MIDEHPQELDVRVGPSIFALLQTNSEHPETCLPGHGSTSETIALRKRQPERRHQSATRDEALVQEHDQVGRPTSTTLASARLWSLRSESRICARVRRRVVEETRKDKNCT
jgi:hypothetical protein